MKKKLKTAVIGVGSMGANHVRVYSEISNLVAVSDINEVTGKQIANKYNTHHYKDYKEMLIKVKPDAVSVVVPTIYHKEVSIACLNQRISVLLEKPIATTIKEAQEIIKIAQENKTPLLIGHIERFNPGIVKVKELIEKGVLGKIINLLAIRVGIAPPKIGQSDVSLDLAIHDIDVFNLLLGEFPQDKKILKNKIFNSNIADWTSIMLKYKSAVGYIQSNWVTPIKIRKLFITGTKGYLEMDYIKQSINFYKSKLWRLKENINNFSNFSSISSDSDKEIIDVLKIEPLKEEIKYFINMVKRKILVDNKYAIEALKIVLSEN